MPRQRKPQNGGQRLWTWRVANTTTGSTTTQTIYKISTWKRYWECDVLNYEVVWTSPIRVNIEWSNVYRVSLDEDALKQIIENYNNLDLSNVTLQTVNGDVTFTGNVTTEWTFTWTTATFNNIEATQWIIQDLSTNNLDALNITSWTVDAGTLWISWSATIWWSISVDGNAEITWTTTTTDLNVVATWTIPTLISDTSAIWSLIVSNWANIANWLNVVWDTILQDTTIENLTVNWTTNTKWVFTAEDDVVVEQNLTVQWEEKINWNLTVNGNTTLNQRLTVWDTAVFNDDVEVKQNLQLTWSAYILWDIETEWNNMVWWNLDVSWTSTLWWDVTMNWNATIKEDLEVKWDATIIDDLTVKWSTHLKDVETVWSVDITWTLRTTWAAVIWNWITVTWQVESDSVVTWNTVTDTLHVYKGLYLQPGATASDFILQSEKNQPNGVAALDSYWKLDNSVLPPLAIWQTFVVDSEANMLALTADIWDICIRTDISKTFIKISDNNPSTLADWQVLQTSWEVISVNWETGAVVLDADDISDVSTTNKFVTATQIAEWTAKQDALGYVPENVANKDTVTLVDSTDHYPSSAVVKTLVDWKQDVLGYTPENVTNKDTATLTDSTDNYPSSHLVKDLLWEKQETLVNQVNIKSINNQSLLGSGNLTITADVEFFYEQTTQGATTYTLQHTPLSDSSIMVFSDSGTALFPMIDYTLNWTEITFVNLDASESAIIRVAAQVANP